MGGTCKTKCDANEIAKRKGCTSSKGYGGRSSDVAEEDVEDDMENSEIEIQRGWGMLGGWHKPQRPQRPHRPNRPSKPKCQCCVPEPVVITPNCTAAAACCDKEPGTTEFYQCCTQYQCCPVCSEETCCYGDQTFQAGDTVLDIPELCQTYVCQREAIVEAPFFQMTLVPVSYECPHCIYGNVTYAIGTTIATFTNECYELKCEADSDGNPEIILSTITCTQCQYESLLFPVGQVIATFSEQCEQLVCSTGSGGTPEIQVQSIPCSYCIYQNETFNVGDVIASFPDECHELTCASDGAGGTTVTLNATSDCPYCQYNGSLFGDGEVILTWDCAQVICNVSGSGEASFAMQPLPCDLCMYNGTTYSVGDVVDTFPDECSELQCSLDADNNTALVLVDTNCTVCEVNGTKYNIGDDIFMCLEGCKKLVCDSDGNGFAVVMESEIDNCTQCFFEDGFYDVGDVVATYPDDCVQLVCNISANTGKPALTVQGAGCNCCKLGDKLYADGELLTDDNHCIAVQCDAGNWTNRGFFSSECRACRIASPVMVFQTFDLTTYTYGESECGYELVNQNGQNVVSTTFGPGYLHESFNFTDTNSAPLSCPAADPLNGCSFGPVTTTPTEANAQGTLVYNMNLGVDYTVVDGTNGITVLYNQFTMFVFAHESVQDQLDGLCGTYNGDSTDDLTNSSGQVTTDVNAFAGSYSTGGANCNLRDLLAFVRLLPRDQNMCDEMSRTGELGGSSCEEQATNAYMGAYNGTYSPEEMANSEEYEEAMMSCVKTMCSCPLEEHTQCYEASNAINMEMMKIKARTYTPVELDEMLGWKPSL
ncbi:hypothetical protein SK128_026337 [Halocaridina rubra]|uniref:VWFD domain-containing protein n=1 Tax=Halocaridina rubra TaxID=373956 RepID=A0AAN9ACU1_HALRR